MLLVYHLRIWERQALELQQVEQRYEAENDGKKPRSADLPFHIVAEKEEYIAVKQRLGLA